MPIKSAQIKSIPYKQKQAHCVFIAKSYNLTFLHSYTVRFPKGEKEGLIII